MVKLAQFQGVKRSGMEWEENGGLHSTTLYKKYSGVPHYSMLHNQILVLAHQNLILNRCRGQRHRSTERHARRHSLGQSRS